MNEQKKTQAEMVLDYIHEYGSITQLEAIRDIGCYRLASRISDLKKAGFPIVGRPEAVPNRYGGKSHIKRYSLQGGGVDG